MFKNVVFPEALAHIADKGQQKEDRGNQLLEPVCRDLRIILQGHGEERQDKNNQRDERSDGQVLQAPADLLRLPRPRFSPPSLNAEPQGDRQKKAGGQPTPRHERWKPRKQEMGKHRNSMRVTMPINNARMEALASISACSSVPPCQVKSRSRRRTVTRLIKHPI